MKKFAFSMFCIVLLFSGSLSAQTGVRFGLKTGLSLATQYGISPADDIYTVETSNHVEHQRPDRD